MTDLMIGYWAPPRLDFPRGQAARFDNQLSFVGLLFARVAPLRCRWPLTRRHSRRRRCRIPLSAACSYCAYSLLCWLPLLLHRRHRHWLRPQPALLLPLVHLSEDL